MSFTQRDVDQKNAKVLAGKMKQPGLNLKPVAEILKPKHRPKHRPNSYNPKIVTAFFAEHGIPEPEYEFYFHPTRDWRFDLAFPNRTRKIFDETGNVSAIATIEGGAGDGGLAIEVDGGIFCGGGHNRGAQMLKTWEKENESVAMGWRIIRCQPSDLCTETVAALVKRCLKIS